MPCIIFDGEDNAANGTDTVGDQVDRWCNAERRKGNKIIITKRTNYVASGGSRTDSIRNMRMTIFYTTEKFKR